MKNSQLLDAVQRELHIKRGQWPQIALDAGLDYSWLSKLAQGKIADPGVRKIEALATRLGIPVGCESEAVQRLNEPGLAPVVPVQQKAAE